jgi:hypothetical protein
MAMAGRNVRIMRFSLPRFATPCVPRPDQASHNASTNSYVFERAVTFREPGGSTTNGRIDLYRRGSFVLEAKQSRNPGGSKAIPEQGDLLAAAPVEPTPRGRRSASRGWDVLMLSARRQAEDYAKALPASEGWPPFLVICDVGHCFETFADFTEKGKNYAQFPDRQGFRIFFEDLLNVVWALRTGGWLGIGNASNEILCKISPLCHARHPRKQTVMN